MEIVCVAAFHHAEEALVARSKLQFYGIPATFPEEHLVRFKSLYAQGATLCRIEVPARFVDDAIYLLNATDDVEPEDYGDLKKGALHSLILCMALFIYGPIHLIWVFFPLFRHLMKGIKSLHRLR